MTNNKHMNGSRLNRERTKVNVQNESKHVSYEECEDSKAVKNIKMFSLILTSILIALVVFITLMGVAYKNTIDTYIEYDKVQYELYGESDFLK